jgi:hypothetical protein
MLQGSDRCARGRCGDFDANLDLGVAVENDLAYEHRMFNPS